MTMQLVPLCSLVLALAPSLTIGTGSAGNRSVGAIRSATLAGERLSGSLASPAAADWLIRTGTIGVIDARMAIQIDDGALIDISYGGRLDLSNPSAGLTTCIGPVFDTGDERYVRLNRIQAVGKGALSFTANATRIDYELSETV